MNPYPATAMFRAARMSGLRTGLALALVLAAACAADSAGTDAAVAPVAANAHIIPFTPDMRAGALANRPDSDQVEFSDGMRMRVGTLRRLSAWGQKARSTPNKSFPAALTATPAAAGRPVRNASDLAEALKLPDSETLTFPSGRRARVGQIKLVLPEVEKRLGHPLSGSMPPKLSGPARAVTADTRWKAVLQQPDDTVLEAPDGQRIAVGMLKQALRESGAQRGTPPTGVAPESGSPAPVPSSPTDTR